MGVLGSGERGTGGGWAQRRDVHSPPEWGGLFDLGGTLAKSPPHSGTPRVGVVPPGGSPPEWGGLWGPGVGAGWECLFLGNKLLHPRVGGTSGRSGWESNSGVLSKFAAGGENFSDFKVSIERY